MEGGNDQILGLFPDTKIYWSEPDVPEIGITNKMRYNVAVNNLVRSFLEYKNAIFNLGSLATDTEIIATRDQALNSLLTKISNLDSSDLTHSGVPFNNNRLSVESAKFLGSKFNYSIATDSAGAKLGINLKEGLPTDVLSTRIVVSGKSGTGKNILMDSPEQISSVTVTNENYPIDIDISARIQTKTGLVDLTKRVVLHNPAEAGEFQSVYDVKDRSYAAPFTGKLSEVLGSLEATQTRLEMYHDVLKNTPNGDIVNTVSGHDYAISSINNTIKEMSTVNLTLTESDGKTTTKLVTPQQAIDQLTNKVNALLVDNTQLKSDLKAAQNILSNISINPAGGGIAGTVSDDGASLSTNTA